MVIIHYEVEYDMNKLILLNEVIKVKAKNENKFFEYNTIKREEENSNQRYANFEKKFSLYHDNYEETDLSTEKFKSSKYEKRLNEIMERIFLKCNNILIIEFINSIYNDALSKNSKIECIKNKEIINNSEVINFEDSNYNIRVTVEDEYRKFEYKIQFQASDEQNIGILINKIDLNDNYNNVINIGKKKKEYENHNIDLNLREDYTKCLVVLNSNIEVPDSYEFKTNFDGNDSTYKINVIKGWKYDFKQLIEKNMYLLFPMKILDLRKRLLSMNEDLLSKDLIKDEIFRFFKDMNKYLKKIRDINLIMDKDINELNLVATDLLNHFTKEKNNNFLDITTDIEATLKGIVV
jgi:hypothetical protein